MKSRVLVKIIKLISFFMFIGIIVFLTIKTYPFFQKIMTEAGREEFRDYIRNFGAFGIIIICGVELIKMFLVVLPEEPIEILAGMCYGSIGGLLVMSLAIFTSNYVIFYFSRKFGKSFVTEFVPKAKLDKVLNNKILKNPKTLENTLWMIFFIPFLPKDIFTYIGGLLPIDPVRFCTIATFARFTTIIASTLAGSSVLEGNILQTVLSYGLTFIFSIVVITVLGSKNKKLLGDIKDLKEDIETK